VQKARTLVGLDASAAMLVEATNPIQANHVTAGAITLVRGDLATTTFPEQSFDLVYSIGVLAEHVPLDASLATKVSTWLRPGGRCACTSVDPSSRDVPRTLSRRLAAMALPLAPGGLGRRLHRRLMSDGMYGDERWIREVLEGPFVIETLEQFRSDVHLHGRCVARKK
jgi:ubiquinone/menaquinone biosynthesis C-methylase UbiE